MVSASPKKQKTSQCRPSLYLGPPPPASSSVVDLVLCKKATICWKLHCCFLLFILLMVTLNSQCGAVSYSLLTLSSWFLLISWLFAPYIFNPSGLNDTRLWRILMIGLIGFCIKVELVLKETIVGDLGGMKNRHISKLSEAEYLK